jgi:uncharacterized protein YecT (DUF1311 family)
MVRALFFLTGFLCICTVMSSGGQAQAAPGFDCAQAKSAVEKLICGDPKIAAADASMAQLFALARTSAFGSGTSNQLAAQRDWLKTRDGCMALGKTKSADGSINGPRECVVREYRRRNGELAVASLLSHPDVALPVLRRDYPKMASLYQALQLYQLKPATAKWSDPAQRPTRLRIIDLLEPYFADLKNDDNKSYGYSILSDIAASPADAISSDAKFASSFALIGTYVPNEDGAASVTFPCAAIVKRPEMISAASPYFGSTLDNFLPQPDCEQSLPAQPRLEALSKAVQSFWSDDCGGGTIRFAIYRGYFRDVTSARIGLPVGNGKAKALARKGIKPALVREALLELEEQYWRYNGLNKVEAKRRARYWLAQILYGGEECYAE